MAVVESFFNPALKWLFVKGDDGYGPLNAGISDITQNKVARWWVFSIHIDRAVFKNTSVMNRARKPNENVQKSCAGVTNSLHVNGVELFITKVVIFVLIWGLNSNKTAVHCTNSFVKSFVEG
ncbi:hypothetical protein XENOCAPTIV_004722 [Xenoophorus captivus]|uniref:Uncharacterized protein n=1 Tax=Xenoophorus captivus TaxID=1517983 RepID=A0ABV0RXM3_9TELE